jgi:hypothetical protein
MGKVGYFAESDGNATVQEIQLSDMSSFILAANGLSDLRSKPILSPQLVAWLAPEEVEMSQSKLRREKSAKSVYTSRW